MSNLLDKDRPQLNWMQTHSGLQFTPFDPQPEQICLEDIAHALAFNCRYNGHSKKFYSVAEHSVYVSYIVSEEDALWGLLHDAAEAYISDLPKPFKDGIAEHIDPHEEKILWAIAEKFGLEELYPPSVKKADWAVLVAERTQVMEHQEHIWDSVVNFPDDPPEIEIEFWPPHVAKQRFIGRFLELTQ